MKKLVGLVFLFGAVLVAPANAAFLTFTTGVNTFYGGKSNAISAPAYVAASVNDAINQSRSTNPLTVYTLSTLQFPVSSPYLNGITGASWVTSSPKFKSDGTPETDSSGVVSDRNLDPKIDNVRNWDGYYAYSVKFDSIGGDISISGQFRSDNDLLGIFFNNDQLVPNPANTVKNFLAPTPTSFGYAATTTVGTNWLTFVVRNEAQTGGNPQSFLTSVKLENAPGSGAIVPVPASAVLFMLGLPLIRLARRRGSN